MNQPLIDNTRQSLTNTRSSKEKHRYLKITAKGKMDAKKKMAKKVAKKAVVKKMGKKK